MSTSTLSHMTSEVLKGSSVVSKRVSWRVRAMRFLAGWFAVSLVFMPAAWAENVGVPFVIYTDVPASVGEFDVPELPGYSCGFNPDQSESWLICEQLPVVDFSIENFTVNGVVIDVADWTAMQTPLASALAAVNGAVCYDRGIVELGGLDVAENLFCPED